MARGNRLTQCQLCDREVGAENLHEHHLIPKLQMKRMKRRGRDVENAVAQFCKPCHSEVHGQFESAALAREFSTLESLRSAERMQTYLEWIRKKRC